MYYPRCQCKNFLKNERVKGLQVEESVRKDEGGEAKGVGKATGKNKKLGQEWMREGGYGAPSKNGKRGRNANEGTCRARGC